MKPEWGIGDACIQEEVRIRRWPGCQHAFFERYVRSPANQKRKKNDYQKRIQIKKTQAILNQTLNTFFKYQPGRH